MNKKLVAPFLIWIMFLIIDMVSLIKGISLHETWRITAAGVALVIASVFLAMIIKHTAKELKAVRVRK